MALPPAAKTISQPMSPPDVVDFELLISQGDADTDLLDVDETVTSFALVTTAEAALAGLTIINDDKPAPTLVGTVLRFWLRVAASQWSAAAFRGSGASLGLELTFQTSGGRTRQRTFIIKVAKQ